MFNTNANTMFNNALFNCATILAMHEQMTRLYQAAEDLKKTTGQSAVAALLNESPQTLNNWEVRGMSKNGMLKAEEAIGCRARWLQNGSGEMSASGIGRRKVIQFDKNNLEFVEIRKVQLKLSAGISGFSIDHIQEDALPITFRRDWFVKNGYNPEDLIAIKVNGDSMEPALYADDTVVINTADKIPKDGIVFAVNYEGEDVVKRLLRDNGEWWLLSDNPDQRRFPKKLCAGAECILIGRIVHKQSEHI
jgi:phage repressor protein C with HTH and peptisase S24 domain